MDPAVEEPVLDIPSLALNYRKLVLSFGMQLVVGAGSVPLRELTLSDASAPTDSIRIALPYLAITIALVIYAYRTAKALGSKASLVWAIAMLAPLINLITLAALSANATRVCRQHGIPVGLFGPRIHS